MVRVWGAEGQSGLSKELVRGVRGIVRRVGAEHPIALMADHHPGDHGVVGSIVLSREEIVPDLIGGDCGCGICAVHLGFSCDELSSQARADIYRRILEEVPVGGAQNIRVRPEVKDLELWDRLQALPFVKARDMKKLLLQFASLGGGNHFIELARDSREAVWLLIHSGSRYLGGLLLEQYFGRSLRLSDEESRRFLEEQHVVMDFARLSRREMGQRIWHCLEGLGVALTRPFGVEVDVSHNYVECRDENGARAAFHRKGACAAYANQLGIIAGSMGAGSFLVEGRGNSAAYSSSSHGAGRLFSRRDAFHKVDVKQFFDDMKGICWAGSELLKDEAPAAYRNIDRVLAAQGDLVRIRDRLIPMVSVKGER